MSKIFKIKSLPKFKLKVFETSKFKPKTIKGDSASKGKPEAQIQSEILSYLDSQKISWWVLNIKGDPFVKNGVIHFQKNENSGFADILVNWYGLFITFEVKKCGGVWSVIQQEFDEKVDKSMGVYRIVTSVEEVKCFFENYAKLDFVKKWLNRIE